MNELAINAVNVPTVQSELSIEETKDNLLSTINPETKEDKVKLFKAMISADYALKDMVNKEIKVVDFVAHMVALTNEETGEVNNVIRCVFIDDKNKSYACVSTGIVGAMKRMIPIFGYPTTKEPWKITPKMVKGKKWDYLSVDVNV